jgi:hypothetical protein
MIYTRRQLVEAGIASGALALLASPLLAARGESGAAAAGSTGAAPHEAPDLAPARPRVPVDPSVHPRLVARARAAFDRHRSRIVHNDVVGIADFSRGSSQTRFYLLNTYTGHVTQHFVSHGRGSDPAHTGFLQRFSNEFGSNATSDGGYVTGAYYEGKYGRSLRLHGLDPTNDNAEARAIVIHPAWYAEPDIVSRTGRLGRSEGCFAFGHDSQREVLARLGPGRFLYADRIA